MKLDSIKTICGIVALLCFLQLLLYGIKQCIFVFIQRTDYSDHMASMVGMIMITICFVVLARKHHMELSIFPKKFGVAYIMATIVVAALMIATPSNFSGGFQPITLLVFSSIVTPIFEEIIFRGYMWNRLNSVFSKEWRTYITSTILFALWHIGYISAIAFRVNTGLADAMMWKVLVGLCFGILLGAVRLKTKNSYSTMLLHGVLNIFGR